nr:ribosomal protein L6 [Coccidia sp. AB-2023a]
MNIFYKKVLNIKLYPSLKIFWVYDKINEMVSVTIKGELGILRLNIPKISTVSISKQFIYLTYTNKKFYSINKTLFKLILSNIKGVNNIYNINLQLSGIGYKVLFKNSNLYFDLGYSHKIIVKIPNHIQVEIKNQNTNLILKSINKVELGKVASRLMTLKPKDPYKGKGIINILQPITLKQGKTKTH